MFIKKKNFFNFENQIILTNGATIKIKSTKYVKNYELNKPILKNINLPENNLLIKENLFLKKIKKN